MELGERSNDSISSSEEEDEDTVTRKRPLYNDQDAMELKLKQLKTDLDWIQNVDIVTNLKDLPVLKDDDGKGVQTDIQDDFKCEMIFYCQAQVAAKKALSKLRNLGIPTERPEDYFAEMVKSDNHMQKVRQKLLDRKQGMEKSEKAKKQRQLKKIGKKIQQDVLQKRQQDKKKMLQQVDRVKKGKDKLEQPNKGEDMFDVKTENKKTINNKRKRKDEKFGYGGKKRKAKKNTAESYQEAMGSFKPSIHGKSKYVNARQKFGNKNANSKVKRLGKFRRAKAASENRKR